MSDRQDATHVTDDVTRDFFMSVRVWLCNAMKVTCTLCGLAWFLKLTAGVIKASQLHHHKVKLQYQFPP